MANKVSDAAENVTLGDLSSLSDQTRQLYRVLAEKDEGLPQMLYGIWEAANKGSDESLAQAAHSARELMEKAPAKIPDVPVSQGSGNLANDVRVLQEAWRSVKADNPNCPPWAGDINSSLGGWLEKAEVFFEDFSNSHQIRAQQIQLTITSLDQSGQSLPSSLVDEKVREWNNLRQYFIKVAHHNKKTDDESLRQKVTELEVFLLNLLYPKPIQDMDEIDALIAEGKNL